ncbi:hypothetical protein CG001_02315, partial [Mesoplasma coleopterae]|uniref:hypothetical protein n=1 Tax=Mesoplasma coleopterae TaxID=324078 RepID=UPI000D203F54
QPEAGTYADVTRNYTATVKAIENDKDYTGSVSIKFSVTANETKEISTVLPKDTEILGVEKADVAEVKAAVETQVEALKGHIEIADIKEVKPEAGTYADVTRNYTATVKAIDNDKDYTGTVSIKFSVTANETKEISTVLKDNTEITGVQKADVAGVKSAVEAQFPVLKDHIEIADITEVQPEAGNYANVTRKYTATVKAIDNDKDYTGTVSIKFSVTANETKEISTVLKDNTEITGVQKADVAGVKAAVEAQFPVLKDHIEIADITEVQPEAGNYANVTRNYTATVKAIDNDKDYTGTVSIQFSINFEQVDVQKIVEPLNDLPNDTSTKKEFQNFIDSAINSDRQFKNKVTYKITEDQTDPSKITIELLPASNNIELVNNQVVTKTVKVSSKFSYSIISDKYSN